MLLNCPSCNTRYLIDIADILPNGKNVQCANCLNKWFQHLEEEDKNEIPLTSFKQKQENKNYEKTLPSTLVETRKPSTINSVLMIILLIAVIGIYFALKNLDNGIYYLFQFYIFELIDFFKLQIKYLSFLVFQILN